MEPPLKKSRTVPSAYSVARRDEMVNETLHGTPVLDAYRWLEDPDSEETKAFVAAQNLHYEHSVTHLENLRQTINKRMTELFNFPKFSCYQREGCQLVFEYNTGLQQQNVVYVQAELGRESVVLLDPNTFSEDGTVALRDKAFSRDGTIMSYGVSASGSDWTTLKFLRVDSNGKNGKNGQGECRDELKQVKFSCQAWWRSDGLFYNRYLPESKHDGTETNSNRHQKLFYHKLHTPQSEDILVWEYPSNPELMCHATVTDDDQYLLLFIRKGCERKNLLWAVDLRSTPITKIKDNWIKVVDHWKGEFDYVANDGSDFVFATTYSAPRKRVVRISNLLNPQHGHESQWVDLIPEGDHVIEFAKAVAQDFMVVEHMKDVKSSLAVYRLKDGSHVRDIVLPVGAVVGFSGKRCLKEVFVKFTSFLEPGVLYRLGDVTGNDTLETVKSTELAGGLDLSAFETKQVFFESEDKTRIPMFLVHRKGITLDGQNPTLLYGYGGFNISQTPAFSVSRLLWCSHLCGVLAVANIRGGGEYGLTWHDAGRLKNKQNCFTDFQCAAKYLVSQKYTSANRLAIQGGSNGGLLVCVCANQAPSLFRAVVSQVGVLDILRFHKFTIGHAWTSDFGNPEDPEDFAVAYKYSALHNIRKPPEDAAWQYPSMLLLTADHDDRVVPLHSFKFIAELQYTAGRSPAQTNPLLIKVDTKSGHGAGKPTSKIIEEASHVWAFIADATGAIWK